MARLREIARPDVEQHDLLGLERLLERELAYRQLDVVEAEHLRRLLYGLGVDRLGFLLGVFFLRIAVGRAGIAVFAVSTAVAAAVAHVVIGASDVVAVCIVFAVDVVVSIFVVTVDLFGALVIVLVSAFAVRARRLDDRARADLLLGSGNGLELPVGQGDVLGGEALAYRVGRRLGIALDRLAHHRQRRREVSRERERRRVVFREAPTFVPLVEHGHAVLRGIGVVCPGVRLRGGVIVGEHAREMHGLGLGGGELDHLLLQVGAERGVLVGMGGDPAHVGVVLSGADELLGETAADEVGERLLVDRGLVLFLGRLLVPSRTEQRREVRDEADEARDEQRREHDGDGAHDDGRDQTEPVHDRMCEIDGGSGQPDEEVLHAVERRRAPARVAAASRVARVAVVAAGATVRAAVVVAAVVVAVTFVAAVVVAVTFVAAVAVGAGALGAPSAAGIAAAASAVQVVRIVRGLAAALVITA